ncbi:hypothetical protein [Streptomyces sp. NPDC047097]|uniref:hypothetical protein n=1 Tax=Streptomyces sp. NPDC047097 TaxID=3155260 RepID=UPI0033F42D37
MSTPAQPASPTTDPGTQPAIPPEPQAPAPAQPEPTAPATEPTVEPAAKAPEFTGEFDPDRAKRAIQKAREGEKEAQQRAAAAEKKFQDDLAARDKKWADELAARDKRLAAAFGWDTPEEKPLTAEELTAKLVEEQDRTKASDDRARQTQVELAVYKAAAAHGGDPNALLDSRAFEAAIKKLNPATDDFATQVGNAITAAVQANPKLAAKVPEVKAPAPTPAGGAPMDPAGGGKRQLTAADAARMTPDEIAKAVKEGRFNAYASGG